MGGKGGEHRKRIKKGLKEIFWKNPFLLPWIYMCTLNGCNVLWASLIAQLVKNLSAMQETPVRFLGLEDPTGEWIGYPLHYSWVSLEESACSVGDLGSIAGLGRSPGEGKGCPLQYSGLENSMDYMSPWGHKESDMTE